MIEVATTYKMGAHLKELISQDPRYKSLRQFGIASLKKREDIDELETTDPRIPNETNRLSQITKGIKKIQLVDLKVFSELLGVSMEELLWGETRELEEGPLCNESVGKSRDPSVWKEYLERPECPACYTDEYGKTLLDYAVKYQNEDLLDFLLEEGYLIPSSTDEDIRSVPGMGAEFVLPQEEESSVRYDWCGNYREAMYRMRDDIIAMAREHGDSEMLRKLRADR